MDAKESDGRIGLEMSKATTKRQESIARGVQPMKEVSACQGRFHQPDPIRPCAATKLTYVYLNGTGRQLRPAVCVALGPRITASENDRVSELDGKRNIVHSAAPDSLPSPSQALKQNVCVFISR